MLISRKINLPNSSFVLQEECVVPECYLPILRLERFSLDFDSCFFILVYYISNFLNFHLNQFKTLHLMYLFLYFIWIYSHSKTTAIRSRSESKCEKFGPQNVNFYDENKSNVFKWEIVSFWKSQKHFKQIEGKSKMK